MTVTNLIVALVFAGVFGAALIYVALWFIHRCIHQRCYEFEHWFHFLFPSHPKPPPCVYVEEAEPSRHRSRSTKRAQGRSERSQTRKYYENRDRESREIRDANAEWPRPRDVERARPMIQYNTHTQPQQQQPYGQLYYPSFGQEEWPGASQVGYRQQMQHQIPMLWQAQGVAHMPLFAMPGAVPEQPFPQVAARMSEPLQYPPQYQQDQSHFLQPYTETMTSDMPKAGRRRTPTVKLKYPGRRARRVENVDFIHICDEYPPIVLKALKKTAPQSSSSSSSSDTSGTTQEVPRVSIPQAAPGFADTSPLKFPQYPHTVTRSWNTPSSYPRQWNHNTVGVDRSDAQDRYAPFTPMSGYTAGPWGLHTDRRRSAPKSSAATSRSYERTTSPRRGGPRKDQSREEGHAAKATNTKLNENECQGTQKERVVTSVRNEQPELGGRYDRQPEQNLGQKRSSPVQQVPRYCPMPIPVVEEPSTPTSEGHTSIPKIPSASGGAAHPKTSPAPLSPISRNRNPIRSPRSSVSSLDKGV